MMVSHKEELYQLPHYHTNRLVSHLSSYKDLIHQTCNLTEAKKFIHSPSVSSLQIFQAHQRHRHDHLHLDLSLTKIIDMNTALLHAFAFPLIRNFHKHNHSDGK